MIGKKFNQNYTRSILIQMLVVLLLLAAIVVWQWDVVYAIYVDNQINAVGWAVNGGILLLFACGIFELIKRFYSYRNEELSIQRFLVNVSNNEEPLLDVRQDYMIAERFLTLKALNRRRAHINQNALAATLLASESSRNSFLKFVHNVLILAGVFGTIISLSISLLGASDLIQSSTLEAGQIEGGLNAQGDSLGTIIYGMSTALSTTMTAILAYLFFGYFYIKLTDTQTYLISKIEEVTATTLLPHIQVNQDAIVKDHSESIRASNELIKRLDKSQKIYAESAQTLQAAAEQLSASLESGAGDSEISNAELLEAVRRVIEMQQESTSQTQDNMEEMISILQRGFRLRAK